MTAQNLVQGRLETFEIAGRHQLEMVLIKLLVMFHRVFLAGVSMFAESGSNMAALRDN